MLDLARNFVAIPVRRHQDQILSLARALAEPPGRTISYSPGGGGRCPGLFCSLDWGEASRRKGLGAIGREMGPRKGARGELVRYANSARGASRARTSVREREGVAQHGPA